MNKKREKKVLNFRPEWGQLHAYVRDETITINEISYGEGCKDIDFTIEEAKSLLEIWPKLIAAAEENKKRNEEEE